MTPVLDFNDPSTFQVVYKEKYSQDDAWIKAFLTTCQIGHVATRWENQPFITPVLFWYSEKKRGIYFHTNLYGRLQANCEKYPEVCFECCEMGKLLPANTAMSFGMQYASVVAFGKIRQVHDDEEKTLGLMGLLEKYFADLKAGVDYRPITQDELDQTAVFCIDIHSWSGKKNWKERATQCDEWKPLDESVFERYARQA